MILKNITPLILIFGSELWGRQTGSSLADASLEKLFSRKTLSLGDKKGLVLPNRLLSSFGRASSIKKKIMTSLLSKSQIMILWLVKRLKKKTF